MYKAAWGDFTYSNPGTFNAEPRRAVDYQNITFMYGEGYKGPDPKDGGSALYNGFHFVKTWGGQDFFNWYLYHDVFGQFNSDYYYLKDAVLNRGLGTRGISSPDRIPRFVNRMAGAIHRAAPGSLVTVGADNIIYTSDRPGLARNSWEPANQNWYSDARLVSAGGDAQGTLDFYQAHSYPDWSDPNVNDIDRDQMPFFRPKSYFQLDKPLLAGEFWDAVAGGPQGKNPLTPQAWFDLAGNGYAGGLGWAWFDVREEFGASLAHPYRYVVKHQMQDHWKPLLQEVTAKMRDPKHTFAKLNLYPEYNQVQTAVHTAKQGVAPGSDNAPKAAPAAPATVNAAQKPVQPPAAAPAPAAPPPAAAARVPAYPEGAVGDVGLPPLDRMVPLGLLEPAAPAPSGAGWQRVFVNGSTETATAGRRLLRA